MQIGNIQTQGSWKREKGNLGPRPQIYLELRINNKNHELQEIVQIADQLFL